MTRADPATRPEGESCVPTTPSPPARPAALARARLAALPRAAAAARRRRPRRPATPLDAVTITGDVGTKPAGRPGRSQMTADRRPDQDADQGRRRHDRRTATRSGPDLDRQRLHPEEGLSTYDQGRPQIVTVDDQLQPGLPRRHQGRTRSAPGSRSPRPPTRSSAPSGNPQLGIGNKDAVLIIIDLVSKPKPPRRPRGQVAAVARVGPEGRREEGRPVTALDFKGTPRSPTASSAPPSLIQGTGADGQEGPDDHGQLPRPGLRRQEAVRRELQRATPADRSPSAPARSSRAGTRRSSGQKVGSRVMLAIPPEDGYGKPGQPQAGHQGHRHAVLRGRHPRGRLSTMEPCTARSAG